MPAYDNTAVAAKLDLAADLLELTGADKFRFLSYRKAASAIRSWTEQVAVLSADGRLTEIPGVGAKMAANIEQVVRTGTFDALDRLRQQVPPTLASVMEIPGVGPKRAAMLFEKLGVATVDDLESALSDGRVASLGGFGTKTAENMAAGLEAYRRHRARTPIGVALPVAEQLLAEIAGLPDVVRVAIAGSVRRREETVGNLDFVVDTYAPSDVLAALTALPAVERLLPGDDGAFRAELHDGLEIRVHLVAPESFGSALRYHTGSVAHNTQLAEHARAARVPLGPDEPAADESEVYRSLGMQCPVPEIRWGAGEVESAARGDLPALIALGDVLGDLQSHSTYTDGKTTLAENRAVAAELGYEYLAATDHAYNLRMVGGLDVAQIERQFAEIDALNETAGPRILKGIELNIAEDGSLDYDDEVLARFDIVLASLHSGWDQDAATVTRRLLAAIEHPLVDVIAHPTGRIIGRRDPLRLDMETVLQAAGETGTVMEINSYPDRLDLSAEHIRLARESGVRFSLGTDAHSAEQLRYMRYGVAQARRGLVSADELVNAQPWEIARTWLKRHRSLGVGR